MNEFAASQHVIEAIYLIASALFILSLKWMSSPTTARHGIWAGELGMVLAIAGTLLHHGIVDYKWIAVGLVLGSGIGIPLGTVGHPRREQTSVDGRGLWDPPIDRNWECSTGPGTKDSSDGATRLFGLATLVEVLVVRHGS